MKNIKMRMLSIFLSVMMLLGVLPINIVLSYADSSLNKEEVLNIVKGYKPHQDNPHPYYYFNKEEIVLDIGESTELSILDEQNNDTVVDGLSWYVISIYPYDKIYEKLQTQATNTDSYIRINDDYTITGITAGEGYIVAVDGEYIHRIDFKVNSELQTTLNQKKEELKVKTDEIIGKTMHLSDVEKALYIHNWCADNIEYNYSHHYKFQPYFPIVEKKAVCIGFANAFKYLMHQYGIKTKVEACYAGDERHAINKVYLDGRGYYVDTTWDNKRPEKDYEKYRYFLLSKDMITKTHDGIKFYEDELYGGEYESYVYQKNGMSAKTEQELNELASGIVSILNRGSNKIKILVDEQYTFNDVRSTLKKEAMNSGVNIKVTQLDIDDRARVNYSGYNLFLINVELRSFNTFRNVDVQMNAIDFDKDKTTDTINIKLDKNVELGYYNVIIDNAKKEKLRKIADNEYELEISNITDDKVNIQIIKRDHKFNIASPNVNVKVVKISKPNAKLIGVGKNSAKLQNITENTKYNLGDGIWLDAIENKEITIKAGRVYLQNQSKDGSYSDIQKISIDYVDEPNWIELNEDENGNEILYLNTNMEYLKVGEDIWKRVSDNSLKNIEKGEYHFRLRGREGAFASEITVVYVTKDPIVSDDVVDPSNTTGSGIVVDESNDEEKEGNSGIDNSSDEGNNEGDNDENADNEHSIDNEENSGNIDKNENDIEDNPSNTTGSGIVVDESNNDESGTEDNPSNTTGSGTVVDENSPEKEENSDTENSNESNEENNSSINDEKNKEKEGNSDIDNSGHEGNNEGDNDENADNEHSIDNEENSGNIDKNENDIEDNPSNTTGSGIVVDESNNDESSTEDNPSNTTGSGTVVDENSPEKEENSDTENSNESNEENNSSINDEENKENEGNVDVDSPSHEDISKKKKKKKSRNLNEVESERIKSQVQVKPLLDERNTNINKVDKVNKNRKVDQKNKYFADILSTSWYSEAVQFVSERNIFAGTSKNLFNPDMKMTRAMVVTLLYNLSDDQTLADEKTQNTRSFYDVSGTWYENGANWAYLKGLTTGTGNNKFEGNTNVTREQLISMLYGYAKLNNYVLSYNDDLHYIDVSDIADYANIPMKWAVTHGLIVGNSNGQLMPRAETTRAEMAVILKNFIEKFDY